MIKVEVNKNPPYAEKEIIGMVNNRPVIKIRKYDRGWVVDESSAIPSNILSACDMLECYSQVLTQLKKSLK